MRKTFYICLIIVMNVPLISKVFAANTISYNFSINVYDVSLIRINPSTSFSLSLLSSQAGGSMSPVTNSSSYLQLTSIPPENVSRRIMAKIQSSTNPNGVPPGTKLTLYAVKQTGYYGIVGDAAPEITLSLSSNGLLIDNIASGYTGTSSGQGFRLYYTLQVDPATYSQLKATQTISAVVVYTISNNP